MSEIEHTEIIIYKVGKNKYSLVPVLREVIGIS